MALLYKRHDGIPKFALWWQGVVEGAVSAVEEASNQAADSEHVKNARGMLKPHFVGVYSSVTSFLRKQVSLPSSCSLLAQSLVCFFSFSRLAPSDSSLPFRDWIGPTPQPQLCSPADRRDNAALCKIQVAASAASGDHSLDFCRGGPVCQVPGMVTPACQEAAAPAPHMLRSMKQHVLRSMKQHCALHDSSDSLYSNTCAPCICSYRLRRASTASETMGQGLALVLGPPRFFLRSLDVGGLSCWGAGGLLQIQEDVL